MLREAASFITFNRVRLEHGSRLAYALKSFIYDTAKIFLLLSVISYAISAIRSYFPPELTKKILYHKKEFIRNIHTGLVVNSKLKHPGRPLPGIDKATALIKEEA
jgi:uncharacterized membrane protein YraQ (UPF0718 family)